MKLQSQLLDNLPSSMPSLSVGGAIVLNEQCTRIAEEILNEAARIEASRREDNAIAEITASDVRGATKYIFRPRRKKSKTIWFKITQTISFVSSMISGSLIDPEKFRDKILLYVFVLTFTIAICTTIYTTFLSDND